jgi:hypothetical protein
MEFLEKRANEEETDPYSSSDVVEAEPGVVDDDSSDTKAVISFHELFIDLDRFEGLSDDQIRDHLRRIGNLATDGQIKEVISMHPTHPFDGSHQELVELYVQRTMETIARLRA